MTSTKRKTRGQRRRHDRQRQTQARARRDAAAAAAAEAQARVSLVAQQAASSRLSRRRTATLAAMVGAATAVALLTGIKLLDGHDHTAQLAERSGSSLAFAPPHPLRPGTSYVETRVLPSGDLQVTHWIRGRRPLSTILVSPPNVTVPARLRVEDLKVVTGGTSVPRAGGFATVRHPAIFNLDDGQRVVVSYRIAGAVQRDTMPAGRALAAITALTVSSDRHPSNTTYAVVGARVLNLGCSAGTPSAVPQPCGEPDGNGWQVNLAGAHVDDRVMAQLDLG